MDDFFNSQYEYYYITPDEYATLTNILGENAEAFLAEFALDNYYGLYFIPTNKIDTEADKLIEYDMIHPWVYTQSGQPAVNYPA